jgi:predicted secreted protein
VGISAEQLRKKKPSASHRWREEAMSLVEKEEKRPPAQRLRLMTIRLRLITMLASPGERSTNHEALEMALAGGLKRL